MSVTRSSTSSLLSQFKKFFSQPATSNTSSLANHGTSMPPAMGHGQAHTLKSAVWNGAAMFFGTCGWMVVYWGRHLFAKMDNGGPASYTLHSVTMGVAANLVAYPFVRYDHLARGETVAQANAEFKKYFILCTIPDALYEPTADWLASMSIANSVIHFPFTMYADPTFEPWEMVGAFTFFGGAYGMIYYFGDKLIQRLSPDKNTGEADDYNASEDRYLLPKILNKSRLLLVSDEGVAIMAALQYFIFYLTDNIFDVEWDSFEYTIPQLLGMAGLMAFYTFAVDAMPVLLQSIETNLSVPTPSNESSIDRYARRLYPDNRTDEAAVGLLSAGDHSDDVIIPLANAMNTLWATSQAVPDSVDWNEDADAARAYHPF